jgi:hypothetical protein
LPLLLHRLISQRAASASQRTATCCPLLIPVASCLPAGCHVASCRAANSHHLSLCRHLTCPSSTPCLHLHWLVVASHLILLPPPPVLLSTLPLLNAPPPHVSCLPFVCPNWLPRCLMWHLHLTSASLPSPPPPPLVASCSLPPWLVEVFRRRVTATVISSLAAFG